MDMVVLAQQVGRVKSFRQMNHPETHQSKDNTQSSRFQKEFPKVSGEVGE